MATQDAFTIGRAVDNDIVIRNPHVSGHHARLIRTPTGLEIEDLGSTNHTFVNGLQVRRTAVRQGDSIQFSAHCSLDWNEPVLRNWLSQGAQQRLTPSILPARPVAWESNRAGDSVPVPSSYPVRPVPWERQFDSSLPQRQEASQKQFDRDVRREAVPSGSSIPERCPNCGSQNIRKLSLHKEGQKSQGGGCSSCLLLIIIGILAPGLIVVLGLGAALGLAGITYFIVENKEIFIAGSVVFLIIGIAVSLNNARTYVCEKCGSRFK